MIPIIYTGKDCKPCQAVKRWFDKNGIIYEERDARQHIDEMRQFGLSSVPVVSYRGQLIIGYDVEKLSKAFPE